MTTTIHRSLVRRVAPWLTARRAPWLAPSIVVLALLTIVGVTARTAVGATNERGPSLRAAYVYNFMKFVDWPSTSFASERQALQVCVGGDHELAHALTALEGKPMHDRVVTVRVATEIHDVQSCHVLLLDPAQDPAQKARVRAIMDTVGAGPVLTIGSGSAFTDEGGIIGFVVRRNRLRFVINAAAAKRARLGISSRLLSLAEGIVRSPSAHP